MTEPLELPDHYIVQRWRNDFLSLNQARLDVARKEMTSRQRVVLDILPILLHTNHTRLPGYVSNKVPAGILGFNPAAIHREALQNVARGLILGSQPRERHILGIYLMGSIGSIAQSKNSDLDVWLCHDESLSEEALAALQDKCTRIEKWADQQGCELHFFLMNLAHFREGQHRSADGEDCGSTQHLLLLDEFYRTAVYLAGATPRWWITPLRYEAKAQQYWNQLVDEHRVDKRQWLDVGEIPTIPADEFVGAGLWQLTKGLSYPYKSLLKLALTRHYAMQFPHIRPLCWDLKHRVHRGITDAMECDAYILMLERLEKFTREEGDLDRLQLIRRSFYVKLGIALTRLSRTKQDTWRAVTLRKWVYEWGWNMTQCRDLDERNQWTPKEVMSERQKLVTEMLTCYRFLAMFSQQETPKLHIDPMDLRMLGNRLTAAFEARPGKIININPKIRQSMRQDNITLKYSNERWQLFACPSQEIDSSVVLKQGSSLIELLAFARKNEMLHSDSRAELVAGTSRLGNYELRELMRAIVEIRPLEIGGRQYMIPSRPLMWHVFVNTGIDPQAEHHIEGLHTFSNRDDALSYSSKRQNLVQSFDILTLNSWGEWQVSSFTGETAIFQALQFFIRYHEQSRLYGWPEWSVYCFSQGQAMAIKERVDQLIRDLMAHLAQESPSPYLLQSANNYYLLNFASGELAVEHATSVSQLLALLTRPRSDYRRWVLDRNALPDTPLRCVLEHSEPEVWQIFYWQEREHLYIYILDEHGALYYQGFGNRDARQWLIPLLRFLNQLDQRWQHSFLNVRPIHLWELKHRPNTLIFDCHKRKIPEMVRKPATIELRAEIDEHSNLSLYCNGQEFSSAEYGDQLYDAAVQTVFHSRPSGQRYPCRLSDLHIAESRCLLTYLNERRTIEKGLLLASQELLKKPSDVDIG